MSLRADIENAIGDTLDTMHITDVVRLADALMPLVERRLRAAIDAALFAEPYDTIEAIVARALRTE